MVSDEPPRRLLPQISPKPTPEQFTEALKRLRHWAGLTLKQLNLPISTSSDYLRGVRLPTEDYVDAFVFRCLQHAKKEGLLPADFDLYAELNKWRRAWSHADTQQQRNQATPAQPAVEPSSEAPGDSANDYMAEEVWRLVRNVAVALAGLVVAYNGARLGVEATLKQPPRPSAREYQEARIWARTVGRYPTRPTK